MQAQRHHINTVSKTLAVQATTQLQGSSKHLHLLDAKVDERMQRMKAHYTTTAEMTLNYCTYHVLLQVGGACTGCCVRNAR